jgi:hypothetical protein
VVEADENRQGFAFRDGTRSLACKARAASDLEA